MAGDIAFYAGTYGLLTGNPVAGGVAVSSGVVQAGFAVGRVLLAPEGERLNEAIEVSVGFVLGRVAAGGARRAFEAAGRTGLINELSSQLSSRIAPVAQTIVERGSLVGRNLIRNGRQTINNVIDETINQGGEFVAGQLRPLLPERRVGSACTRGCRRSRRPSLQVPGGRRRRQVRDINPRTNDEQGSGVRVPRQGIVSSKEISALMDQALAYTRSATEHGTARDK